MSYRRYPNVTAEEEARIRKDAAYGGLKDGGEALLRQLQREREQGGTDEQVLEYAKQQNPYAVQKALDEARYDCQMGGWKNADEMAKKIVVDRLAGRK